MEKHSNPRDSLSDKDYGKRYLVESSSLQVRYIEVGLLVLYRQVKIQLAI